MNKRSSCLHKQSQEGTRQHQSILALIGWFWNHAGKEGKRIPRPEETTSWYFAKKIWSAPFLLLSTRQRFRSPPCLFIGPGKQQFLVAQNFLSLQFYTFAEFSKHSVFIRFSFHCKQLFSILKATHCSKVGKAKQIFKTILPGELVPQECPQHKKRLVHRGYF